ncbi:MAG: hypothetical protein PVH88_18905 [Ignavibacteria bacterium]|jgi:hypothetical protein
MKKMLLMLFIALYCNNYSQDKIEIFNIKYNYSNFSNNESIKELKANLNYGIKFSEYFTGFANINYLKLNFNGNNFSPNAGINAGVLIPAENSKHVIAFGIESSIDKEYLSDEFLKYSAFYKYTNSLNRKIDISMGLYYKKELVDDLIFPLLGGKFKITENLSIEGLLPINIKVDQKINNKISLGFLTEWDIYTVTNDNGLFRNETIGIFGFMNFEILKNIFLQASIGKNIFSDSYLLDNSDDSKLIINRKNKLALGINLTYSIND